MNDLFISNYLWCFALKCVTLNCLIKWKQVKNSHQISIKKNIQEFSHTFECPQRSNENILEIIRICVEKLKISFQNNFFCALSLLENHHNVSSLSRVSSLGIDHKRDQEEMDGYFMWELLVTDINLLLFVAVVQHRARYFSRFKLIWFTEN